MIAHQQSFGLGSQNYLESKPNEDVDKDGNIFTLNLRFPGQYFDKETNKHYNINRDYDPVTGRYIQSDPIGFDGGINIYLYVGANPVVRVDESGLCDCVSRQILYYELITFGYFAKLDSDFERRMLHRWLFREGDYTLTSQEFFEIVEGADYIDIQNDKFLISTYNMPKYDFAIGRATLTREGYWIVGFYDSYDFNKGNRSKLAEIATRVGNGLEALANAKPFLIVYP